MKHPWTWTTVRRLIMEVGGGLGGGGQRGKRWNNCNNINNTNFKKKAVNSKKKN